MEDNDHAITEIEKKGSRMRRAVLLVAYKYFYRSVSTSEISKEMEAGGWLTMSDEEFDALVSRINFEKNAMLKFFERSDEWLNKKLDDRRGCG